MFLPMPRIGYRKYVGGKAVVINPRERTNDYILELCERLDLFIFVSVEKDSILLRAYIRSQPHKSATFYTWNPSEYVECPTIFRKIRKILDEKC